MLTQGKLVVLKLDGNLEQDGFRVALEIAPEGDRFLVEQIATLPPDLELVAQLRQWQQAYRSQSLTSRIMPQEITYGGSVNWRHDCQQFAHKLGERLNLWLASPEFRSIDRCLRETLTLDEPIRVMIRTQDPKVRRLPWHLWDLMERYTKAEIALGALSSQRIAVGQAATTKEVVKILAILGNRTGIDVEADRKMLEQLPDAEVTWLVEPGRQAITQQLWQQSWDILFFAGHSQAEGNQGRLYINSQESLTLEELKYGLRQAIARGLQLAIFNSCDGLGLAQELEQLHLPQLIVMREPVPDPVAQAFLKDFLLAFVQGKSLYLSAREARERLQGLEDEFPCASWLPIICQNSVDVPPDWHDLLDRQAATNRPRSEPTVPIDALAAIVFTDVESFTSRMLADEKHTLSLVQRDFQVMRRLCQRFEGKVLKSLGDGLLMYFASAERAVSCAISIQTELAETAAKISARDSLRHRIGIHLGDVELSDGDVLGSGVNIAARLQREAPAGGICLSRTVYEVVKNRLSLPAKDGGLRQLKGIPESLKVYQIPPPKIQEAPTPLTRSTLHLPSLSGRSLREVLFTSWIVTSLIMGVRLLGGLQPVEFWAFDHLLRLRPLENPDDRIVLVTVNEEDLKYQNRANMQRRGSLSDQALSQVLAKLQSYQAIAVGVDIYRDFSIPLGETTSKSQLKSLFAVCTIGGGKKNIPTIEPPPGLAMEQVGFGDLPLDADEVVRRHLIGMSPNHHCNTDKSLSYQLARHYFVQHQFQPALVNGQLQISQQAFPKLTSYRGLYQAEIGGGYTIGLNYRANPAAFRQISLSQFLSNTADEELSPLIRNRVVLIGTIARSFNDYHTTPYGEMSGVEIHAHMTSQMLSAVFDDRPLLWTLPQWGDLIWIWGWASLAGSLGLKPNSRLFLALVVCGALASLYGLCFLLLLQGGCLPIVPSALAFATTAYLVSSRISRSTSSY